MGHAASWHAVHRVSVDAGVSHPERVSTLYAAMQSTEKNRQLFYKHMGHSRNINENIYQVPLAEAEILNAASRLIIIIIIKRQFIRRSNITRVTTRAPNNVRCSYSGRQLVTEVGSRKQMCLEHHFER